MLRHGQVEFRMQFLLDVLMLDKAGGGGFTFTRETLTGFWTRAMLRPAGEKDAMVTEERFWGGDAVTDNLRLAFLRAVSQRPFHVYSGFVLLRFLSSFCLSLVLIGRTRNSFDFLWRRPYRAFR